MSEARSIGPGSPVSNPQVEAAISRAAQSTGVDFAYLLGQARLESNLDPNARAATSSAAGLYQFTQGTWLSTLKSHGGQYGYGWTSDPALRTKALALRFDPQASAIMAAELADDNREALRGVLGREPDPAELYLAHFLGAQGASKFLSALAVDPDQAAPPLFSKAAPANRAIFFTRSGQPRSLRDVMGVIQGKMDAALGSETEATGFEDFRQVAPAGQESTLAARLDRRADPEWSGAASARPSMAETLAAAFGGPATAMPGQVRRAYDQLRVFGL